MQTPDIHVFERSDVGENVIRLIVSYVLQQIGLLLLKAAQVQSELHEIDS